MMMSVAANVGIVPCVVWSWQACKGATRVQQVMLAAMNADLPMCAGLVPRLRLDDRRRICLHPRQGFPCDERGVTWPEQNLLHPSQI